MSRPNLLLILSDQHNPHVMGCAGDPWVNTPNLDALAARSVLFSQAYCASPLCVPSRMAFLSGRYPSDTGVLTNSALMNPNIPTFAHLLSLSGYDTVLCGRMHFTDADQHHGFHDRLVGDMSHAMEGGNITFGGVIPTHCCGQDHPSVRDAGPGKSSYMAYDEQVFDRAGQWLRERGRSGNASPFCLLAGGVLPHNPYVCPKELFDRYMDELPSAVESEAIDRLHPAMQKWRMVRGVDQLTTEQMRRARAAYYGLVEYLDGLIGRLLEALADSGLAENTVVAYLSDHGEMAGEHGLWWKDSLYEGSVGVPMIWSWPGHFAQRQVHADPVSLLDVAPTCLELAQADPLPLCRGQSLTPLLSGGGAAAARSIFSENYPIGMFPARMIRRGRWKLNHFDGYEHPQLFDLQSDPEERNDLGRSPAFAEVREDLKRQVLDGWSGRQVRETAELREREFQLIGRYNEKIGAGESELWREPVEVNQVQWASD